MLAAERGWGGGAERPFLPRAFSVADATAAEGGVRLTFLLEDVGPGTHELARLAEGDGLLLTGPLGRPFSAPREVNPDAAGAILVGGGIGLAPLALLRRDLAARGFPERSLLGFRDEAHSGGLELFRCSELRLASEDGHAGHRGYVTDLLAVLLEGDDAAATAVVYACGPPAMLEAVRALCEQRSVAAELAMFDHFEPFARGETDLVVRRIYVHKFADELATQLHWMHSDALCAMADYAGCLASVERTLAWQRTRLSDDHPRVMFTRIRRVNALGKLDRTEDALAESQGLAEAVDRVYGRESAFSASVHNGYGNILNDHGDLSDAIDLRPASGDLLVMGGRCQQDWLHAVPKTQGRVTERISAQWRWTSGRGSRDTNPGYRAARQFGDGSRRR